MDDNTQRIAYTRTELLVLRSSPFVVASQLSDHFRSINAVIIAPEHESPDDQSAVVGETE